jgi:hypothetical protein
MGDSLRKAHPPLSPWLAYVSVSIPLLGWMSLTVAVAPGSRSFSGGVTDRLPRRYAAVPRAGQGRRRDKRD